MTWVESFQESIVFLNARRDGKGDVNSEEREFYSDLLWLFVQIRKNYKIKEEIF